MTMRIEPTEKGAWRDLESKLRPFVARRVGRHEDVDDVLQDIFVRMQTSLASVRDDERFGPWTYRVARSAIVDHGRRASKHRVVDARDEEPIVDDEPNDRRAEEELAGVLTVFVAALPSPYREAVTLTELEGMTQREAAEMLGITLAAMKSRVLRGRALLRRSLEDCCHIALDARGRVVECEPRPDGRMPDGCCATQPCDAAARRDP
ncbi:MAG: sigma-70 family RNA polymerase sigma factor [Deltaproteobacteria bacterium]|nr:sigma-70 family RNA polymerase sigma factor [Deltaproteobacteria bacterium]